MKNTGHAWTLLLLAAAILPAFVESSSMEAPVIVTAWGTHLGREVEYRYQVENRGRHEVRQLLIGHYPDAMNGAAELSVGPLYEATDPSWLPPALAGRPNGWGVHPIYPQESKTFYLEWIEGRHFYRIWPKASHPTNSPAILKESSAIPPATVQDNFSVKLPMIDPAYVNGHASIDYGGNLLNVKLVKGDSTAPSINFRVTRNTSENNPQWAIFDIEVSAQDDFDPSPELVFVPISANQNLAPGDFVFLAQKNGWQVRLKNYPGRVYHLEFKARDASGNESAKSFDYFAKTP